MTSETQSLYITLRQRAAKALRKVRAIDNGTLAWVAEEERAQIIRATYYGEYCGYKSAAALLKLSQIPQLQAEL